MVRSQLIARHLIANSLTQTVNRRDSSTLRQLTARHLNGCTFNSVTRPRSAYHYYITSFLLCVKTKYKNKILLHLKWMQCLELAQKVKRHCCIGSSNTWRNAVTSMARRHGGVGITSHCKARLVCWHMVAKRHRVLLNNQVANSASWMNVLSVLSLPLDNRKYLFTFYCSSFTFVT